MTIEVMVLIDKKQNVDGLKTLKNIEDYNRLTVQW